MITHNFDMAARADAVYMLADGRIVERGDPVQLKLNRNSVFAQGFA